MTREPTEMEKRVATALGWDGNDDYWLDVTRVAIRAMRVSTDAMENIVRKNQEIKELVEEGMPPINAVWVAMIDAASPQEE